ncbi:nicotinate-nucleotide--dimethylbenzimidazole phosphoribosyltransferase [Spirochaetota bacterium]
MEYTEMIKGIKKPENALLVAAQHKIDHKTKPLGALGMLEDIACRMCLIQNDLEPRIKKKMLFVYAGDHGIANEGVSAYPAEVTPQMVLNFLGGGAAINVLCKHNDIDIRIIDAGVNFDFKPQKGLVQKKVRKGTDNFLKGSAMTRDEAERSIQNGIDVFNEAYPEGDGGIIAVGDMGIGNTTSASAIISAVTGKDPKETTGSGTGINESTLKRKIDTIKNALSKHAPDPGDPLDILSKVGGFEIGGITGTVLAAAHRGVPVVLDGIISTAGGLLAYLFNNNAGEYLFAGHKSVEKGHMAALDHMHLNPIIDLNMRLGEGSGAALAVNIIEAACRIMCEMASFEEAGVSNKE